MEGEENLDMWIEEKVIPSVIRALGLSQKERGS